MAVAVDNKILRANLEAVKKRRGGSVAVIAAVSGISERAINVFINGMDGALSYQEKRMLLRLSLEK